MGKSSKLKFVIYSILSEYPEDSGTGTGLKITYSVEQNICLSGPVMPPRSLRCQADPKTQLSRAIHKIWSNGNEPKGNVNH